MADVSKSSKVFFDILVGFGISIFVAFALIFAKHNLEVAIILSIIYSIIQYQSFWRLFKEQQYVGMFGRLVVSSLFVCVLGGIVWGIFYFNIDLFDKILLVGIILVSIILSSCHSILKNYFPKNPLNKKIQQTFAGLSAIGVLNSEEDK